MNSNTIYGYIHFYYTKNLKYKNVKEDLEDYYKKLGIKRPKDFYGYMSDDYIMKPFDAKELVARVKAVLRSYQVGSKPETPQADKGKCVEYPGIEINLTNYSVIVDGHTVEMPPKELELLYFLASSPNQVFTREQLLDQIWGYEYIGDTRTVDVHIKRLREKIKDHNGWSLSTVWGIGYKFEVK